MSDDVLIDAGPLVALLDRTDQWHLLCRRAFERIDRAVIAVWPAIAEASHLLKQVHRGETTLLDVISSERFKIASLDREDIPRIQELMAKYHDLPMDLADAAIVQVAERERISRVFTIDQKDFRIYAPRTYGISR
jgi:uncharacterized protein